MTPQIIRFSVICKKRLHHFLSKNQYCWDNLRDLGERILPGNLMGSLSAMLLSEPTCTTVPCSALSSVTDPQRQVPTPRNKTSLSSRPGHPSSENIQSNLLKVILIFPGQMDWCFWDWQIDANLPGVDLYSGSVELQLHSVVFSLCHSSFLPHRIFFFFTQDF